MRINIYSQELLLGGEADDTLWAPAVEPIVQTADTGVIYSAVRLYLHSSERLHHPPKDDDRSAITFWIPQSPERREMLARQFDSLASMVRTAMPETGLD